MTQIIYVSTDSMPFVPVEVTDPYVPDKTEYPLVLEEPTGIAQPKYDWTKSEWTENPTGSITDQLSALKDSVSTLTDAIALGVISSADSAGVGSTTENGELAGEASSNTMASEPASISTSESGSTSKSDS